MAHPWQVAIEDDVRALMGTADEGIWQEEGLFATVDSLGVIPQCRAPSEL
jgi:hypothetical protein